MTRHLGQQQFDELVEAVRRLRSADTAAVAEDLGITYRGALYRLKLACDAGLIRRTRMRAPRWCTPENEDVARQAHVELARAKDAARCRARRAAAAALRQPRGWAHQPFVQRIVPASSAPRPGAKIPVSVFLIDQLEES